MMRLYGKLHQECKNQTENKHDLMYADDYISFHTSPDAYEETDRYVLIFSGNIYNKQAIINKLTSHHIHPVQHATKALLLQLYTIEKERCVNMLRGMFTFVIWDKQTHTLFAARDPFGMERFYMKETKNGLHSASDLRFLLEGESDILSQAALQHYLTFQYVPGEHSMLAGVQQLKAGHFFIKEEGKQLTMKEYYPLTFTIDHSQSFAQCVSQTREAIEESVAKHMTNEGEIGAYLSGGIDSTSIVALAKQHQPNLETFTVGFKRQAYSEIDLAKETADDLQVKNKEKIITPDDVMEEMDAIVGSMGSPIADPAAIPNYFVAKEASKQVDITLSGEGADELFGGYQIYYEPQSLRVFDYIPNIIRQFLHWFSHILPDGLKGKSFLWRGTTALKNRYVGNAYIFSEKKKRAILQQYDDAHPYTNVTKNLYKRVQKEDQSTQMQYIDLHTWLPGDILTVAHTMSRAHALEMRVPFLDKKVFDVAKTVPTNMKLTKKTTKYVLREAVKDLLPKPVIYREKLGFPVPVRHWLRHEMYDWAKNIFQHSQASQLFQQEKILGLLEDHARHKRDYSRELWTILTFFIWYDQCFTNPS